MQNMHIFVTATKLLPPVGTGHLLVFLIYGASACPFVGPNQSIAMLSFLNYKAAGCTLSIMQ